MTKWQPYVDARARNTHVASQDLAGLVGAHAPNPATDERLQSMPGALLSTNTHSQAVADEARLQPIQRACTSGMRQCWPV